tara:strand:- start:5040 stop:5978 length:939 start_codon:yes stop_codon:yes gene_type:complete
MKINNLDFETWTDAQIRRFLNKIVEATAASYCIMGVIFAQSIIAFGHAYGVNLGHILADESRIDRREILVTLLGNFINFGRGMGMFDAAIPTEMGPVPVAFKSGSASDITMECDEFFQLEKAGAPFWLIQVNGDATVPTRLVGEVEPAENLTMRRINLMDLVRYERSIGNDPRKVAEKGVKDNRAIYTRLDRGYPRLAIRWSKVPAHVWMDAEPVPFAAELPAPSREIVPKKIRPLVCRGPFRVFMHKIEMDGEVVTLRKGERDLLRAICLAKSGEFVEAKNRQTIKTLRERLGVHGELIQTKRSEGLYLAV